MRTGCFVFFGPVGVGKSTMIGYLYSQSLSKDRYEKEVAKFREIIGGNFRSDRFYTYFVDTTKDEYTKQIDKDTHGTSKKMHLSRYGDFNLIDTPGGAEYAKQRYKGLSMASVGVFAIEIGQLINDQSGVLGLNGYKKFNDFFSTWFIWKKMHGVQNTIIMLTKYDINQGKSNYEKAVSYLRSILGDDIDHTVIVPTAVDSVKKEDVNVLKKMDESWYDGMCLMDTMKSKSRDLGSDDEMRSLLMIHNEFKVIYSTTSKSRWKVLKGRIHINDRIKIAPISIKEMLVCPSVVVKEIEVGESNKEEAFAGEIINVGLSICEGWNGNMPQIAIAANENDEVSCGNAMSLRIEKNDFITEPEWERLCRLKEKQQLSVIWFSDSVSGEIKEIQIYDNQIDLEFVLKSENAVAFPTKMFPQTVIIQLPVNIEKEPSFTIRGQVVDIN